MGGWKKLLLKNFKSLTAGFTADPGVKGLRKNFLDVGFDFYDRF